MAYTYRIDANFCGHIITAPRSSRKQGKTAMAVYTVLDRKDIELFIKPFSIGPLIDFEGVAEGIENTNYFISTDQSDFPSETQTDPIRRYVLTVFEIIDKSELPFFIELTTLLNQQGLPVPCPLKDVNGNAMHAIQNKPAVLVPRVPGSHPTTPTLDQCQELGRTLGEIHTSCLEAELKHNGSRGLGWLSQCADQLYPLLNRVDQKLLSEVERFTQLVSTYPNLPQAVIHGDLFRDNTLFDGNTLTALIDFNNAGTGFLMLDLAIVINDWCSNEDGSLNNHLAKTIIEAYQTARAFTPEEISLWNDFLRIAAARFWISRLIVQLQPNSDHKPGSLVAVKDPQQYKNILLQHIEHPQQITTQ